MSSRILLVEDDAALRKTFRRYLVRAGHEVGEADTAEGAFQAMSDFAPDIVVTDIQLPGMSGLELLATLRASVPELDVIVVTGHEDMRTAIDAMKQGAYDYLVKPLALDELGVAVDRCLRDRAVRRRMQHLADEAAEPYSLDRLVGRSPRMIEIYKLIGTLATNRAPVFIRGETGTGKELIARAIHFNSDRAAEPFIAVNCTELPETLLESELFGHVRGAFTGAMQDRRGRFELAGQGTIFLDEIGDTTPAFQAKLLRVLQEHEFFPVGAERPRRSEARIIAATNQPVEKLVRDGRFREDLYFRLKVVEIEVPPLRDRREDIPPLAKHLLARISRDVHKDVYVIPEPVQEELTAYDWPGNVRELENALTRAVVLARGPALAPEDLSLSGEVLEATARSAQLPEDFSLEAAERAQVQRVLEHTGGNKRQAARLLEISRPRLDRMIDRLGVEVPARAQGAGP